mgnify:CR=1 FL=1
MVEENSKSPRKEDDSKSDKKKEVTGTNNSEFDKLMKGASKSSKGNKIVKQNQTSDDKPKADTITSEYSQEISDRISKAKVYRYIPTFEIICFTLLTCGFYSYYLTYKQTEAIRKIDNKSNGLFEPILVVLAIIFSCGLAGLYIHYKIPERAAYISRKSGGNTNDLRIKIDPPVKDLAMISLIGNIIWMVFFLIVTVASAGILTLLFYPIYIAYWVWLTYSIQRSVEYMLCIGQPLEE